MTYIAKLIIHSALGHPQNTYQSESALGKEWTKGTEHEHMQEKNKLKNEVKLYIQKKKKTQVTD